MDNAEDGGRLPSALPDGLLAAPRRRYLLYCLCRCAGSVDLPTVADRVTEWETGDPAEERREERLRIYMSLYHDHVPPLVDAGLVAYDQEADAVELAADPGAIRAYLRRTTPADLPDPAPRDSTPDAASKPGSHSWADGEGRGRE